jgi:hypothetical protein
VEDPRATAAKVRTGMRKAFTPDGKRNGPAPAQQGPRDTEQGSSGLDLPRSHSALLDVIEAAWAKIDHDRLSPAERKRVAAIVDSMGEIRTQPARSA